MATHFHFLHMVFSKLLYFSRVLDQKSRVYVSIQLLVYICTNTICVHNFLNLYFQTNVV